MGLRAGQTPPLRASLSEDQPRLEIGSQSHPDRRLSIEGFPRDTALSISSVSWGLVCLSYD